MSSLVWPRNGQRDTRPSENGCDADTAPNPLDAVRDALREPPAAANWNEAGEIVTRPFWFSEYLLKQALAAADQPLDPWNGMPWSTVSLVNREFAH